MINENRLLTTKEVAEYLGVNEQTVRRWLRDGRIKGVKLGGETWRIKPEGLKEFLDESERLAEQGGEDNNE